jgi:hypothetical protein
MVIYNYILYYVIEVACFLQFDLLQLHFRFVAEAEYYNMSVSEQKSVAYVL